MPLQTGDKLGHYQVISLLGVGGMGEVYRARDTKLKRDVAIKVLPATFLRDPERMARFQKEAEVLASLDHPNIGPIHGIVDSEDSRGLVLALVEGPTLADQIALGPLPLDAALLIAKQIIDALEYAHDRGVVHRDLKPANIKITPEGVVKVLDFGLAKVLEDEPPPASLTNSPTLTLGHTRTGVILGTAAYMSPEQAVGRPVDRRSDIFSFGAVLYEMLTGKRAFSGATTPDVLEAVVKSDPDWLVLATGTPGYLRKLLERTLAKDRKQRLQAIGEARIVIQRADMEPEALAPASHGRSTWLWPSIAALCLIAAVASAALWFVRPAPVSPASRFTLDAPPNMQFTNSNGATAISPDGRYLVFGAAAGSGTATPPLWLRPLDSLDARQLTGTEGANFPFWSPDSKSIAFFASDKLKRVDIAVSAPLVLCDAAQQGVGVGGTWNRDGVILFASVNGLHRVSASGGTQVVLTKVDASRQETAHGYPQFLPDGKHFLYYVQSGDPSTQGVYAASLDRPQQPTQIVRTGAKAMYTPPVTGRPGYLLWLREQTLMAQVFDVGKLRLEGDPSPVAEDIARNRPGRAAFWTSDAGLLAFRRLAYVKAKMLWKSQDGKRIDQVGPEDYYGSMRLSHDGKRVVISRSGGANSYDQWVFEFGRSVMTRVTFDGKGDTEPVWSPDGRQIAFASRGTRARELYRKDASGEGKDEQLTENLGDNTLTDWSPDGRYLLFYQVISSTGGDDLSALPLEGVRKPLPVAHVPAASHHSAQFSPDGKWIAYESVESGRNEIYIRPFTGEQSSPGGKWQVSSQGGEMPRWRGDGKELFYVSDTGGLTSEMMTVGIRPSAAGVQMDTPRELFPVSFPAAVSYPYDVSSDGQRFLVLEAAAGGQTTAPLTVVLNWQASLKP